MATELLTIAGTTVIIAFWLLFLYMAETRKDIGYTFFMMALSAMTFNDTILSEIQYSTGTQAANMPLLMLFISIYEMAMTFLLMRELNDRKKNMHGDEG